jgi:hypothetical protein
MSLLNIVYLCFTLLGFYLNGSLFPVRVFGLELSPGSDCLDLDEF